MSVSDGRDTDQFGPTANTRTKLLTAASLQPKHATHASAIFLFFYTQLTGGHQVYRKTVGAYLEHIAWPSLHQRYYTYVARCYASLLVLFRGPRGSFHLRNTS